MQFNEKELEKSLILLSERLRLNESGGHNLVVCGGSALISVKLVSRTTKDVDVVALCDDENNLLDPAPFPQELTKAAIEVADTLGLPEDWLNNGPSSGE